MTYEERKQQVCDNCASHKNTCGYRCRGLNDKCEYLQTIMEGWELGQQDTHEPASEDLEKAAVGVGLELRDALILEGCDMCHAEIYAAIAQSKFKAGANWQKKQMIDKACKWIAEEAYKYFWWDVFQCFVDYDTKEITEDFRKAMEEQL